MGVLSLLLWGLLTLVSLIILFMVNNVRRHRNYFKTTSIPYMGPGLNRFFKLVTGSAAIIEVEMQMYNEAKKFNSPIVGFTDIILGTYGLYIADLELIKNICVKDFDYFVNRRPIAGQQANLYFRKMLISIESDQWKGVRAKLSPSFTTGKIRRMFKIFTRSSENMSAYVKKHIGQGSDVEICQVFSKYTMDVIAGCAFALDSKAWEVPFGKTSEFEEMGKGFQFNFKPSKLIKFMLMVAVPKVADLLGLEIFDEEAQKYFSGMIKGELKRRRQTGQRNEDFLQLMMDTQAGILKADEETNLVMNGGLENDPENKATLKGTPKVTFDDDDLVANAMLFLLAGFDTTHSLLLFVFYALALEPEVQERLYEEVRSKIEKDGGKVTYENVLDMAYLDLVINETLRKYTPASRTERCCTKDYPVPGSNFTIKKGTVVLIPIYPIHHEPQHFPDPDKFIPERFTSENKSTRSPYAFMAFGHGPRNCIGMRFALMEVKAVIAQLVYTLRFTPSTKTKMEYAQSATLKPKGELWLNIVPR